MDPAENHSEPHFARLASPRVLFIVFLIIIGLGVAGAQASWAASHAVIFTLAGLLMMLFPPVVSLPRAWWMLAAVFGLCLGGAFLPDAWFPAIGWRAHLGALGLDTGTHVTAHPQASAEMAMVLFATLVVGFWIVGHRPSSRGLRLTALLFALGVAGAALLAMAFPTLARNLYGEPAFGFFPNRNHNATLLAMGTLAGLGCMVQAIREKRALTIVLAAVATIICLWGILGWSISRAGVAMLGGGILVWLVLLGPAYIGNHARRALLLLGVAAAGGFLIAESTVKQRLTETLERTQDTSTSLNDLDFRVPTWLDTLAMIRDRSWTGFGPGQFVYVFPQYRHHTITAQRARQLHPESDWLWLAAETGVPATLAVAGLAVMAGFTAVRGLATGRTRALRAGCLVAALLLLFHGMFDVPGHRVPLAWSAALLLGISLVPPEESRTPNPWLSRLAGVAVAALGAWLIFLHGFSATGPAVTAGPRAVAAAFALYQTDQLSLLEGNPVPATPAADPLIQALDLLADATATVPMDPAVHHLRGALALHFPASSHVTEHSFALEHALDPTWVDGLLTQATVYAPVDPQRAGEIIQAARAQCLALDAANLPAPQNSTSWAAALEPRLKYLFRRYPEIPAPSP